MWITPADAVLAGSLLLCSLSLQAALCPPDHIDGTATIKSITDGDTLRLSDGRKVRLIGVNTPELGHGKQANQPLSLKAKQTLRQLLAENQNRVQLRYGQTKKDRYGRHLLHLFLTDGSSVAARLLQNGLGVHITIPANTWNSACYHQAEQQARALNRGLWLPSLESVVESQHITKNSKGFKVIEGTITSAREVKGLHILHMGDALELVIKADERRYFPADFIATLIKQKVEVRGWLYHYKGRPNIRIRHPYSIRIIKEPNPK